VKQFCLGIIVAIGLTLPAFGQGVDPLIGSWKLNLEKSTYVGLSAPKSQTLTWTGEGHNFIDTIEGVNTEGQPSKVILRHIYDGMPRPSTGTRAYDSSTYTRIGNTINWARFRNGKVVTVGQGVFVPGKTYTATEEGIDRNNQPLHDHLMFERQ